MWDDRTNEIADRLQKTINIMLARFDRQNFFFELLVVDEQTYHSDKIGCVDPVKNCRAVEPKSQAVYRDVVLINLSHTWLVCFHWLQLKAPGSKHFFISMGNTRAFPIINFRSTGLSF